MKKNKTLRIASVLLIAVLLTTCIISGTFAKYVTSGEAEDQARVAKFGVVVDAEGTLFARTYYRVNTTNEELGNTATQYPNDGTNYGSLTVESSGTDNVVAPGTKNDKGITISVSGKPEVDVKITFDIASTLEDIFLAQNTRLEEGTAKLKGYPDLTTGAYYTADGKMTSDKTFTNTFGTYYPIRYTVTGSFVEENMDDIKAALEGQNNVSYTDDSVTGTLANIQTALAAIDTYVDANTDLSTIGTLTLTWAWAYEGPTANVVVGRNGATSVISAVTIDKMDTLLGDLAAGEVEGVDASDYNLTVNVALSATVTQVD